MGDIQQWFRSVPPITRVWFSGTIALSVLAKFQIIHPYSLLVFFKEVVHNFQIWRPFTALFFFPASGFGFLIHCYFLYTYSQRLETGLFINRPADYIFMLMFIWLCHTILCLLSFIQLLSASMVMSVLYVWCQVNKDMIVSFWFGTQFKAMYLPWVLFLFNLIIGGGGISDLIGILVGHLYFFLVFKYPQDFGGATLLQTPQILYHYFPNLRSGVSGFGSAPASARPPPDDNRGGFFRGQGHTLG